jgi:hypothetical protein
LKYNTITDELEDLSVLPSLVPYSVYAHATVRIGKYMVSYGGRSLNNQLIYQLSMLDLDTDQWIDVPQSIGDRPTTVIYHSAVSHRGEMFIFGGVDKIGIASDELWSWSIQSHNWTRVQSVADPEKGYPSARFNHTSAYNGTHMIIYGGVTKQEDISDELWILNLNDMKWTSMGDTGIRGEGCTATTIENNILVIGLCFQDTNMYNFDLEQRRVTATTDTLITGSSGYMVQVDNSRGIILEGVWQESILSNSVYLFDNTSVDELFYNSALFSPPPVALSSMIHYGNRIIVYGGKSTKQDFTNFIQIGTLDDRVILSETWAMTIPICDGKNQDSDPCFLCSKGTYQYRNEW